VYVKSLSADLNHKNVICLLCHDVSLSLRI